ncbi:zeta toxin family protein [Novacetimonas hansenii]
MRIYILLKATIANRPGMALVYGTDRRGRRMRRWKRVAAPDAPPAHVHAAAEKEGGVHRSIPPEHFNAVDFAAPYNDHAVSLPEVYHGFPADTQARLDQSADELAKKPTTVELFCHDGVYTPERAALHERILADYTSAERLSKAFPAEGEAPTFIFLGGRGGSGKSALRGIAYGDDALVVDADGIKARLPGYDGTNAHLYHEESSDIAEELMRRLKAIKANIVYDSTMRTTARAVALAKSMKADHYRLEVHYMFLPRLDAARRAVSRYIEDGRLVPPSVVLGNLTNEASFDAVKDLADSWSFRSNLVARGSPPALISEKKDDRTEKSRNVGLSGHGGHSQGEPREAVSGGRDGLGGTRQEGAADAGGSRRDRLTKGLIPSARILVLLPDCRRA